MKRRAIICDIDGCLLDTAYIHKEIEKQGLEGAAKWRYFEAHANDIRKVGFNYNLGGILEMFAVQGFEIILLTARSEAIRNTTKLRLSIELGCKYQLLMRPTDNISPAHSIKRKHLEKILENYEVFLVIDDEDDNLKMFSSCGLFVMKAI